MGYGLRTTAMGLTLYFAPLDFRSWNQGLLEWHKYIESTFITNFYTLFVWVRLRRSLPYTRIPLQFHSFRRRDETRPRFSSKQELDEANDASKKIL